MTGNKKDSKTHPIYINPSDRSSEHCQVIGECGAFGHQQIVKDMLIEELKKIGDTK